MRPCHDTCNACGGGPKPDAHLPFPDGGSAPPVRGHSPQARASIMPGPSPRSARHNKHYVYYPSADRRGALPDKYTASGRCVTGLRPQTNAGALVPIGRPRVSPTARAPGPGAGGYQCPDLPPLPGHAHQKARDRKLKSALPTSKIRHLKTKKILLEI